MERTRAAGAASGPARQRDALALTTCWASRQHHRPHQPHAKLALQPARLADAAGERQRRREYQFSHDAAGRITAERRPDNTDHLYRYGPDGQLAETGKPARRTALRRPRTACTASALTGRVARHGAATTAPNGSITTMPRQAAACSRVPPPPPGRRRGLKRTALSCSTTGRATCCASAA
ncbi:hypothetical protein FQ626_00025 [Erwinia pyrifoliae]|nr:hypothetical protein [Erwinia pyrifoliae]